MRVIANLANNEIIATGSEPGLSEQTTVNGQYVVTYPQGVSVEVGPTSYLTPQDANSVGAQAAAEFLIRYPMYDHVLYSFLLEVSDITGTAPIGGGVDLAVAAPSPATVLGMSAPANGPRCQIGRGAGPAPVGIAPGSVVVLPAAQAQTTARYGSLVSGTYDITQVPISSTGMDECLVWWKISSTADTQDILSGYGVTAGQNSPALREMMQTIQEVPGFQVYVSNDDGVTWYHTQYMEPTDLVNSGTDLRICFANTTTNKIYLHGFCLMFSDIVP